MKIAIINDSHFGARNDANVILEAQDRFFNNLFFPYLKQHGIDTVLHLGDLFDRRKYINFKTLQATEDIIFKPMKELGITMDIIPGNHDVYYKDTNRINSIRLLADKFDNVNVYDEKPVVVDYEGRKIALVPWICRENFEESMEFIKTVDTEIIAGHFEIVGFELLPGVKSHEGLTTKTFERFEQVWSGHYHHRSHNENIFYLGSQYEMTWSDEPQVKGFHVYDTILDEIEFVANPDKIFVKLYYNDEENDYEKVTDDVAGKYVKVIVVNKTNHFVFDRFIHALQTQDPVDLKVVDNEQEFDGDDYDISQTMDTMTILENYIDGMEISADKTRIKKIVRELHTEALSME